MILGKVIAKDLLVAPDLEIDASLRQNLKVKAGNSIRLFSTYRGNPAPTITWRKDEGRLPDKVHVETTGSTTLMLVEDSSRNDSGKYSLTLENSAGSKVVSVSVVVLDSPSAPRSLQTKDVTKESVTLAWQPPENDGGSVVNHYIVEKKESTKKAWSTVTTTCIRTTYKVLLLSCSYRKISLSTVILGYNYAKV